MTLALPFGHDLTHCRKISTCPTCQRATAQNKPHKKKEKKKKNNVVKGDEHSLGG